MAGANLRMALVAGLAALLATGAAAQNQQVYRYVDKDGRVVYSDRGPPADARDIQAKRLRGNVIENNEIPLAAQQAQERFPVTLYKEQWEKLLEKGPEIRQFIADNEPKLKKKED